MPATYAELRHSVEAVVFKGRQEIDRAWLHTYHETGRLINEHLLQNKERADYGAKVYERLAADTGISKRTLHECTQFHRCFPIVRISAQLIRSHYVVLCQVADPAQRKRLQADSIKHGWTVAQLVEHVRPLNALEDANKDAVPESAVAPVRLLTPKRGTPGVCKVIAAGATLVVDLGFATYFDLPADTGLTAGNFVRLDAAGRATVAEGATKADLFTYAAEVLKVVDGDTLWVKIYLRSRQWVKQKLRLRDLDCPEIATPAGKSAKRFTESLVPAGAAVTVCTTKPDKYDRYLADVFVAKPQAKGEDLFLNNELLAAGHAVVKREWEFGDWGEA